MIKRARKWKMWARIRLSADATDEFAFTRDDFWGLTKSNERLIRVEIREIASRKRGKK